MSKRITANELRDAIMGDYHPTTEFSWRGLTIEVKHHLSLAETVGFAGGVADTCFVADTGEYIPEVKDFAIRCAILEYYADIELPEDLEEKCNLVYGSDLIACILQYVDNAQWDALCMAIDDKIDNMASANVGALNRQMSSIASDFERLGKKMEEAFSGVDSSTISKIAGAVVNGGIDENKLVAAFRRDLEQKSNIIQMLNGEK